MKWLDKKLRILFLGLIFVVLFSEVQSQVEVRYIKGQKSLYSYGDEVCLSVLVSTDPKTCKEGMDHVIFYPRGLSIKEQRDWKVLRNGLWQKGLTCIIEGNKRDEAQLTIMRRVDKQSFVYQERFKLKGKQ